MRIPIRIAFGVNAVQMLRLHVRSIALMTENIEGEGSRASLRACLMSVSVFVRIAVAT
jgi:hypothetical protein